MPSCCAWFNFHPSMVITGFFLDPFRSADSSPTTLTLLDRQEVSSSGNLRCFLFLLHTAPQTDYILFSSPDCGLAGAYLPCIWFNVSLKRKRQYTPDETHRFASNTAQGFHRSSTYHLLAKVRHPAMFNSIIVLFSVSRPPAPRSMTCYLASSYCWRTTYPGTYMQYLEWGLAARTAAAAEAGQIEWPCSVSGGTRGQRSAEAWSPAGRAAEDFLMVLHCPEQ